MSHKESGSLTRRLQSAAKLARERLDTVKAWLPLLEWAVIDIILLLVLYFIFEFLERSLPRLWDEVVYWFSVKWNFASHH